MYNRLNATLVELERTRDMVNGSSSLEELHRIVNQLMRDALACSRASETSPKNAQEASLDQLIEALANICIALFDGHHISRDHLLFLVDQALAGHTLRSSHTTH